MYDFFFLFLFLSCSLEKLYWFTLTSTGWHCLFHSTQGYYYLLKFYYYYHNLTGVYQASFTGLISFPLHYNPLKGPFGSLVSLEDWETKGSQMLRVFFFKQIEGNSCDSFYCSGLESNLQYLWGMPITSLGQDKPICSLTCQLWGSAGKESAYNVGDLGSIPALGRSSGEGNGYSSMDYIVHEVS